MTEDSESTDTGCFGLSPEEYLSKSDLKSVPRKLAEYWINSYGLDEGVRRVHLRCERVMMLKTNLYRAKAGLLTARKRPREVSDSEAD